jgi:hypothetical protein
MEEYGSRPSTEIPPRKNKRTIGVGMVRELSWQARTRTGTGQIIFGRKFEAAQDRFNRDQPLAAPPDTRTYMII